MKNKQPIIPQIGNLYQCTVFRTDYSRDTLIVLCLKENQFLLGDNIQDFEIVETPDDEFLEITNIIDNNKSLSDEDVTKVVDYMKKSEGLQKCLLVYAHVQRNQTTLKRIHPLINLTVVGTSQSLRNKTTIFLREEIRT